MMLKRLFFLITFAMFFVIPATNAYAFCVLCTPCSASNTSNPSSTQSSPNGGVCSDPSGSKNPIFGPDGILTSIINLFSIIIGVVAVFAIIVAGLMFVTSGGDSARVNTAKNTILYVIIGVVVVALAQIIVFFVIDKVS